MKSYWFIAKYLPDLRRREPINIGVILFSGDEVMARFLGENDRGVLDGRRLSGKVNSLANYKAWLSHWREAAQGGRPEELMAGHFLGGTSYFIEKGGETIRSSRSAHQMLEHLFGELVAPEITDRLTQAEVIFERLHVEVESDITIPIPVGGDGEMVEEVFFDYRYKNGTTTLMRTLKLGSGKAWDRVNAAVFSFERARQVNAGKLVALCQRRGESPEARSQMRLLERGAEIVELNDSEEAEKRLASVLHVERKVTSP